MIGQLIATVATQSRQHRYDAETALRDAECGGYGVRVHRPGRPDTRYPSIAAYVSAEL